MRRRLLVATIVIVLVIASLSMVACSGDKKDIYPAWVYNNTWSSEEAEAAVPEGANLRIMSYNILVEDWNSRIKTGISDPMSARVEQVAKTIEHYSPDVVGLQEVCQKWHGSAFSKKLKDSYTFVKGVDGLFDYTSMIYNHTKVNLLSSGKEAYSQRSETKMRYAAWAVFEKKDTSQKFVVINTHFDFGNAKKDKQTKQMEEFAALGKKLHEEHSAPVFLVGDYNAYESEVTDKKSPLYEGYQGVDLYNKFVSDNEGVFTDANYVESAVKLGGKNRKPDDPKWDHIFVSNDVTTLKYVILSNDFYTSASDHFPIFVDVAI